MRGGDWVECVCAFVSLAVAGCLWEEGCLVAGMPNVRVCLGVYALLDLETYALAVPVNTLTLNARFSTGATAHAKCCACHLRHRPHTACTCFYALLLWPRSTKEDILSEIRRLQSEMSALEDRVAMSGKMMNGSSGPTGACARQSSAVMLQLEGFDSSFVHCACALPLEARCCTAHAMVVLEEFHKQGCTFSCFSCVPLVSTVVSPRCDWGPC